MDANLSLSTSSESVSEHMLLDLWGLCLKETLEELQVNLDHKVSAFVLHACIHPVTCNIPQFKEKSFFIGYIIEPSRSPSIMLLVCGKIKV